MRLVSIAAAAALAGCDMPPSGEGERREAANQMAAERARAGAEGKAEEGRISIQTPGVDIAINVPDSVRGRAHANVRSELLPPGSRASGLHVQGSDGAAGGDSVELRFAVDRPPAEIAAWYRDPARAPNFTIASAAREGNAIVLAGTSREGGPIHVRLMPRGSGTDGRLVSADRD
ncbi:MAG TPA: hypothetical protein VF702_04130 [Allosphingosinicella sp.]|jgi:hypothetical protein